MKIKIERTALLAGIQRVQGVVEKRNTMPILTHILMEAEGEGIALTATDLEVGIRGTLPAEVIEPGRITLSARKLFEIIRAFPEGTITIGSEANHWAVIEAGKSRFRVVGLPPDEFPLLPVLDAADRIFVGRAALVGLIRRTLFAVGENDPRYVLNAVMVQLEKRSNDKGVIRFIATDGHRLAVAEETFSSEGGVRREEGVILPKKAVLEIKRALEEGEEAGDPAFLIGENQLVYRWGTTVLTARLLEGEFPNYKQAIPSGNDKKASVKKEILEGALRRVSILARERTSAVKLTLEPGRIRLNASNPEMGEASESVPAEFEGEAFSAGFNARYLLDALAALQGETATLEFKDGLSPCLIQEASEGFLTVIMPMRV